MHSPTSATKALVRGVCQDHRSAPGVCNADRDLALYAALGVAALAGAVVGGWYVARWLRS